jgi:uncharacterized protein YqhQ
MKKNKIIYSLIQFLKRQCREFANIGGQAVIEGVMMRSPQSFVVAVRKADGSIRLRRDQWFGLSSKFSFFKKPFLRGVIILIESMANGISSLNYSANIAMEDEIVKEAKEKGKDPKKHLAKHKENEKINLTTFLTIAFSFLFGMALFLMLPHALTAMLEQTLGQVWGLDSFEFHFVDGVIKSLIFILYIVSIGLVPDVKRVFQYHGAEHKAIATFEAGLDLNVKNAKPFSTLHPRCGTSFMFFLIFISIILFSVLFTIIPIGQGYPFILKHIAAILFKITLMMPVAGISYEIIKFSGKYSNNIVCKTLIFPGMMLQKLTTREPDDEQLEVALASIKAVLYLEKKFDLKSKNSKILTRDEIDIKGISEIENVELQHKEFFELS